MPTRYTPIHYVTMTGSTITCACGDWSHATNWTTVPNTVTCPECIKCIGPRQQEFATVEEGPRFGSK